MYHMVAAGANALVTTGDGGASKTADNGVQEGQQLTGDGGRSRNTGFATRRKDSSITPNKTASIRETKASRLRAASIVSPSDNSSVTRRSSSSDNCALPSRSSTYTSTSTSSITQKSPMGSRSSGIPQIYSREKDRLRQATRISDDGDKLMDSSTSDRAASKRLKKLSNSANPQTSPSSSSSSSSSSLSSSLALSAGKPTRVPHIAHNSPRPSSIPTPTSIKSHQSSINHQPSTYSTQVLQRVDALTALTRATMERVERLASSSPSLSSVSSIPLASANPSGPVSILKHKTESLEGNQTEITPNSPLPTVAFKLNDDHNDDHREYRMMRKHGILKKRSSLDESQILRRNQLEMEGIEDLLPMNPESLLSSATSSSRTTETDFRPILKHDRTSSLDELVKVIPSNVDGRNLPSILKNKWSRSGDEDDPCNERQGILKKNSLVDAVAKTLGVTWTELETLDHRKCQEVRPILKKKLSHDESSSSDPPSLEPRPILKKKSSTDSDEHEERPRKTILKYSSRKNSEDSSNESETVPNSPRKLSVLKQNSLQRRTNSLPECDTLTVMKPILKNARSRSIQSTSTHDLFLRKRARSVGHENHANQEKAISNWTEEVCGSLSSPKKINPESIVTFEFPEDPKSDFSEIFIDGSLKHGFDSEEAACRRLDDYSAKVRRDKRSRRFRDRKEMPKQVSEQAKRVDVECESWQGLENGGRLGNLRFLEERGSEEFYGEPVTMVGGAVGFIEEQKEAELDLGCLRGGRGVGSEREEERVPWKERYALREKYPVKEEGKRGRDSMEDPWDGEKDCGKEKEHPLKEKGEEEPSKEREQSKEKDPSKLSLAQRVALFNRKIATESATKAGLSADRIQRRALSRFRTQPVTSEEVEDATRQTPSALVSREDERGTVDGRLLNVKTQDTPKSILKSSSSYTVCTISERTSAKLDLRSDLSQDLARKEDSLRVSPAASAYSDTMKRYGSTVPSHSPTDKKIIDKDSEKTSATVICDKSARGAIESEQLVKNFRGITNSESLNIPGNSIADRLAALKRSGSNDWKRRVISESLPPVIMDKPSDQDKDEPKSDIGQKENEELVTSQKKLADRLEKLESAAEGWRKRVTTADAVKFSVAGKMKIGHTDTIDHTSKTVFESMGNYCSGGERRKNKIKTPLKKDEKKEIGATQECIEVPERKVSKVFTYSNGESENFETSIQQILKPDDETFTSFFDSMALEKCLEESITITSDDFDFLMPASEKLCSRKTTQVQRRRVSTHHNPLKTLAARTDLKSEYTEVRTGVAERLMKLNNLEKLGKQSSLAVEALAGLASTENFSSITLKNADDTSTGFTKLHPKDSHIFLILIKGRRHVQVRLVEPTITSINSGDNFILVTKSHIYHYIGKFSNVIEKSRATEIALKIQQSRDMGCKAPRVIILDEEHPSNLQDFQEFWKLLGHTDTASPKITEAGHPDEDERYESALIDTNIVYEVSNCELIPMEDYWGTIPKIKMLDPSKTLIFDFGSELYIWNGKCATLDSRKSSMHLVELLWEEGYDYTDCSISPIDAAGLIGNRLSPDSSLTPHSLQSPSRPPWCLSAKLTQHMETILFREKFLDWPNGHGLIKCARPIQKDSDKVDGKILIDPPDISSITTQEPAPVDLVLEGSHLGRGDTFFDTEFNRQYLVTTTDVTVWHIDEHSYTKLEESSMGHFYSGESYIIRWMYLITVTGRELSGLPSKHLVEGRDRCAYFIWQGRTASLNKQGTAALLTVELDKEEGPQIRIAEGFEFPAFLSLFKGGMVIHSGRKRVDGNARKSKEARKRLRKQSEECFGEQQGLDEIGDRDKNERLDDMTAFFCRGSRLSETSLLQVPYSSRQLKTRGSLLFVDSKENIIYVWYGRNCLDNVKRNAYHAAELLRDGRAEEMAFKSGKIVDIVEIDEGEEPDQLFVGECYMRSLSRKINGTLRRVERRTPRMFYFSSISGEFRVTQVMCPQRDEEFGTPFPFLQEELYQASQPALFLIDNREELWLWQGWWPDTGAEDQTGSGAVRWQAERRAAMTTALEYWRTMCPGGQSKCPVYLVWAGLEPLEFIQLFPTWANRDDVAEINMKDGRVSGGMLSLENELTRLTQSTYPPAQLLQRPLPEGVDPTSLEVYLSPQHFQDLLGMNIEDFHKLPAWKQIDIKKKIGLF